MQQCTWQPGSHIINQPPLKSKIYKMSWCTVESDPGVFTELIGLLGVKDVDVSEIYSLDVSEQQDREQQSYGLIFLFKYVQETDMREVLDSENVPQVFFAKQVVQDACATQAILSVLLNAPEIDIGAQLSGFKEFTSTLDCESKGMAIGMSEEIRIAHNSFARPEPFVQEKSLRSTGANEDVYHFIAYVPVAGSVYEIDGLKSGPIHLGNYADDDWMSVARPAVEARMQRYSTTETHFALLSINKAKTTVLEQQIAQLENELATAGTAVEGEGTDIAATTSATATIQRRLSDLRNDLSDEKSKLERQRAENIRRRHNYIPFIVALLRLLSQKGQLQPLVESGKGRAKVRRAYEAKHKYQQEQG